MWKKLTMASIKSSFVCLARWTARPRYQAWEMVLVTVYFLMIFPSRGLPAVPVELPISMQVFRIRLSTFLFDSAVSVTEQLPLQSAVATGNTGNPYT